MISSASPRFSQLARPAQSASASNVQFSGKKGHPVRNALGVLGILAALGGGAWGATSYLQADKAYDGKVDIVTLNPANFDKPEYKAIEGASNKKIYLGMGGLLLAIGSQVGRKKRPDESEAEQ